MSKRYMDFVPVKQPKKVGGVAPKRVSINRAPVSPAPKTESTSGETFSIKSGAKLGVVEDLNSKFVRTNVSKRPLGDEATSNRTDIDELAELKAKNLIKDKKSSTRGSDAPKAENKVEDSYKMPKSPFINQANVTKRPLSKHVYAKKIEPVEEEKKGPVKIIEKPDKDGKIGLVITIILTIILGAAAGTIAFLLLPK